ncbi:papain-like cysteine protease family protein [Mucilaginibacter lappiensis]|uniref:Peptidase C39-like domain-containing protein n=1 Tax=Mucilaginibacter lappiensis TaxID=354630 RepID=A0A841JQL1_9SPHI|nr:papain-like cysteine protease family protein [Mucilaginibacter lappiensis]MBB6130585.1 hypothetical protein [Mucilaginibacter lappiensis]
MKNLDELTFLFPEMEQKRQESTLGGDIYSGNYDGGSYYGGSGSDDGIINGGTYDPGVTIYAPPITPGDPYSGPGFNTGGPSDNNNGGGYGDTGSTPTTVPGFCYFDALSFISQQSGVNHDQSYYETKFAQQTGVTSVLNVSPQAALAFVSNNPDFKTVSVGPGTNINVTLAAGYDILTDIRLAGADPGVTHAVVITGYDSSTGQFIYHDPTANINQEAPLNDFFVSMSIGVKGNCP